MNNNSRVNIVCYFQYLSQIIFVAICFYYVINWIKLNDIITNINNFVEEPIISKVKNYFKQLHHRIYLHESITQRVLLRLRNNLILLITCFRATIKKRKFSRREWWNHEVLKEPASYSCANDKHFFNFRRRAWNEYETRFQVGATTPMSCSCLSFQRLWRVSGLFS